MAEASLRFASTTGHDIRPCQRSGRISCEVVARRYMEHDLINRPMAMLPTIEIRMEPMQPMRFE